MHLLTLLQFSVCLAAPFSVFGFGRPTPPTPPKNPFFNALASAEALRKVGKHLASPEARQMALTRVGMAKDGVVVVGKSVVRVATSPATHQKVGYVLKNGKIAAVYAAYEAAKGINDVRNTMFPSPAKKNKMQHVASFLNRANPLRVFARPKKSALRKLRDTIRTNHPFPPQRQLNPFQRVAKSLNPARLRRKQTKTSAGEIFASSFDNDLR